MAAHGTTEYSVAEGNDYPAHEQTYLGFLALVKWGIIIGHHHRGRDGLLPDLTGRAAGRAAFVRAKLGPWETA